MKEELTVRAYREGDGKGILELWKAVYPELEYDEEFWARRWRWMSRDNPAGSGKVFLAEHDGKIVGHSAIVPVSIKIGSEILPGYHTTDSMTHPDYRGKGIFTAIDRNLYAETARDGMNIGYRYPNKLSHRVGIKKLEWFDVATQKMMFKPLNWQNALKLKLGNKFISGFLALAGNLASKTLYRVSKTAAEDLTITQVSSFDDRINDFWVRVSNQSRIIVVRNKDYLNWKYVSVPGRNYLIYIAEKTGQICGYLVLQSTQQEQVKVGVIFDILAESEQTARCLILKATEHCRRQKFDLIACSMIADKSYFRAFRKSGFIPAPAFVIKGRRLCLNSSLTHVSKEFLKNPRNWFAQIGDADKA